VLPERRQEVAREWSCRRDPLRPSSWTGRERHHGLSRCALRTSARRRAALACSHSTRDRSRHRRRRHRRSDCGPAHSGPGQLRARWSGWAEWGLPVAQHLVAGLRQSAPSGHGVRPRRGVRDWQWLGGDVPRRASRSTRRRRRDHQLPARHSRLPGAPAPNGRGRRRLRQLGARRSGGSPAVGARQHRRLRWRSGKRHGLRRVRRIDGHCRPPRFARRPRAFPARDPRERRHDGPRHRVGQHGHQPSRDAASRHRAEEGSARDGAGSRPGRRAAGDRQLRRPGDGHAISSGRRRWTSRPRSGRRDRSRWSVPGRRHGRHEPRRVQVLRVRGRDGRGARRARRATADRGLPRRSRSRRPVALCVGGARRVPWRPQLPQRAGRPVRAAVCRCRGLDLPHPGDTACRGPCGHDRPSLDLHVPVRLGVAVCRWCARRLPRDRAAIRVRQRPAPRRRRLLRRRRRGRVALRLGPRVLGGVRPLRRPVDRLDRPVARLRDRAALHDGARCQHPRRGRTLRAGAAILAGASRSLRWWGPDRGRGRSGYRSPGRGRAGREQRSSGGR